MLGTGTGAGTSSIILVWSVEVVPLVSVPVHLRRYGSVVVVLVITLVAAVPLSVGGAVGGS